MDRGPGWRNAPARRPDEALVARFTRRPFHGERLLGDSGTRTPRTGVGAASMTAQPRGLRSHGSPPPCHLPRTFPGRAWRSVPTVYAERMSWVIRCWSRRAPHGCGPSARRITALVTGSSRSSARRRACTRLDLDRPRQPDRLRIRRHSAGIRCSVRKGPPAPGRAHAVADLFLPESRRRPQAEGDVLEDGERIETAPRTGRRSRSVNAARRGPAVELEHRCPSTLTQPASGSSSRRRA